MTVETKLAELRMQERELLNTLCAECGHRYGGHSWGFRNCIGVPPEMRCSCRGFVETTDEQLVLKESG